MSVPQVRLGRSGLVVSRLALGMMSFGDWRWRDWVLDEQQAEPIVRRAVEAGVTLFDTGNHYSYGASEEITGRLLRRLFARREEYVVATKVGAVLGPGWHERGLSRRHIIAEVEASLRRLGTDYIDLYQIHRWDPHTPIEETVAALDDLVRAGKVRYVGAGSMDAWQFATAHYTTVLRGTAPLVSMQDHYNLLYREEEREMLPLCRELGVGVLPWSPLARGMLAGSRHRGMSVLATPRAAGDAFARQLYTDDDFPVVGAVREVAAARGVPPARVGLAWLWHQPAVTAPILGATRLEHVDDAVAALELTLTSQERERLEAPYQPHSVRGH